MRSTRANAAIDLRPVEQVLDEMGWLLVVDPARIALLAAVDWTPRALESGKIDNGSRRPKRPAFRPAVTREWAAWLDNELMTG